MAREPTAVTSQDSSEIAPTWAMLAGSMMMPDPIMFTVTRKVSCTTLIFFLASAGARTPASRTAAVMRVLLVAVRRRSFAHDVGVEADAPVHLFLVHTLDFVVEAGEAVERFLEGEEVIEHRSGAVVPALAG